MKNTIEKIYIISEIHWDYDYNELEENLAEDVTFDFSSDEALTKMANKIYNDPDELAEYLDLPTSVIIPDYELKPYLEKFDDVGDAIVEYLSDKYGFCIKEYAYNAYIKEN